MRHVFRIFNTGKKIKNKTKQNRTKCTCFVRISEWERSSEPWLTHFEMLKVLIISIYTHINPMYLQRILFYTLDHVCHSSSWRIYFCAQQKKNNNIFECISKMSAQKNSNSKWCLIKMKYNLMPLLHLMWCEHMLCSSLFCVVTIFLCQQMCIWLLPLGMQNNRLQFNRKWVDFSNRTFNQHKKRHNFCSSHSKWIICGRFGWGTWNVTGMKWKKKKLQ